MLAGGFFDAVTRRCLAAVATIATTTARHSKPTSAIATLFGPRFRLRRGT